MWLYRSMYRHGGVLVLSNAVLRDASTTHRRCECVWNGMISATVWMKPDVGAVICVWHCGIGEKSYSRIGTKKVTLEWMIRVVKSMKFCFRFEGCDYKLVKKKKSPTLVDEWVSLGNQVDWRTGNRHSQLCDVSFEMCYFRLPPRSSWELCSSGSLRSE